MSAWECYALGRFFGPKLYEIPWFNHWINPTSVEKLHKTIEYYKYLTFFVIRFVPGGIRNTFFMTCGLGKMPFKTFIFRDGMAVLLSSSVLFHIGYEFADHYHEIVQTIRQYSNYFLLFVLSVIGLIIATLVFKYIKNKRAK
jgi:membrane protein DedA with SNARE-associated domain